jgi:hypothetical protein
LKWTTEEVASLELQFYQLRNEKFSFFWKFLNFHPLRNFISFLENLPVRNFEKKLFIK